MAPAMGPKNSSDFINKAAKLIFCNKKTEIQQKFARPSKTDQTVAQMLRAFHRRIHQVLGRVCGEGFRGLKETVTKGV